MNKLLISFASTIENISVKYFGHPSKEERKNAKHLRLILKYQSNLFIQGVLNQLIVLHTNNEKEMTSENRFLLNRFSNKEKAICTVYEFLSGNVSNIKYK